MHPLDEVRIELHRSVVLDDFILDEVKGKVARVADPLLFPSAEEVEVLAAERHMIGKELAQASATDPAAALAVLKLLLGGHGDRGRVAFDLSRHAIPVVIANAMLSSDGDLKNQAEAYMNDLGARGNLALEDQVQAVLEGKVGVDDVDE